MVEGICRAKVDDKYKDYSKVLPIIIHGDGAIAGQGIAYEVAQMMTLEGYRTGGTVHIVVNNRFHLQRTIWMQDLQHIVQTSQKLQNLL